MESRTYNLYLRDSIFDPQKISVGVEKKATYKKYPTAEREFLYKVWIYLDGKDIPFVQSVRYHLHSSFRNPEYLIEKNLSNPNFMLVIWTWGTFNVKAGITLISGEIIVLNHYLSYAKEIESNENIQWTSATSGSLPSH